MITIQLNASVTVLVSLCQREEIQTTRTTDRVSHHRRFMKTEAEEHYEPVSKSEKNWKMIVVDNEESAYKVEIESLIN